MNKRDSIAILIEANRELGIPMTDEEEKFIKEYSNKYQKNYILIKNLIKDLQINNERA